MTAAIADRGGEKRLVGQVIPPVGTTVGNVLTATATGSSWQPGGGGTSGGSVSRRPAGSVTLTDGYSLVVAVYYAPTGTVTLQGDAVLRIL